MRALPLLILLSAAVVSAETPAESLKRRQLQYPDLLQIVELAQSAPPEFAAQALLRVAGSPKLKDKLWQRELLDQAFQTAAAARAAVPKLIMQVTGTEGTRELALSKASKLGLDRLTLQTTAIKEMLTNDAKHARELFLEMQRPVPARLHCEDALVEDPSAYFSTAMEIAKIESKGDDAALFLNQQVQRISSPMELAPAARMIIGSSVTPPQADLLWASFSAAMQRLDGDDRSFSSSMAAVSEVIPPSLTEAFHQYLTKNLTGPRCADTITNGMLPPEFAKLKPSTVGVPATLTRPPSPDETNQMREKLKALWFGGTAAILTAEQKNTTEWRESFGNLLRDINGIKPAIGEPEDVYFYRKGTALHALYVVAPPGESREKVLQQYLLFLKSSTFPQESPAEWFAQVRDVSDTARAVSPTEYRKLLDAYENSGHPVLTLYARMEKVMPSPPTWAQ